MNLKEIEPIEPSTSDKIIQDPEKCAGCGLCEIACSFFNNKGIISPAFSRLSINYNPLSAKVNFYICKQCKLPSCYLACPLKDEALCMDEETGVIYVNEEKCVGCEKCIEVCPLEPPGIKLNSEEEFAFKCDLCVDRKDGPACVEFCPTDALSVKNGGESR